MLAQASKSVLIYNSLNSVLTRSVQTAAVKINQETSNQEVRPWTDIPGPSALPIIGQLHHFLPGYGALGKMSVMELNDHLYKTYGPIARLLGIFGSKPMTFLFDPEAISQILRGENVMPRRPGFQSLEYYRKEYSRGKDEPERPTGLVTDHGEHWRTVRTQVNPVMMKPKTVKLYTSVLDEVALDMIKRMRTLRDDKNMITEDLDNEMNKWALESIGVVALGGRIGCFDPSLPEDSPAKQMIQCVHDIFVIADEIDFKPSLWRYYPTRKFKKAMKLYQQQIDLGKYFIKRAMKELEANKSQRSDDEKGVLEKLMEIDEHTAVTMASDMLFAGVDTASNTILANLYLLAVNQDKQDKLREELFSGEEKRPYLKACLKEAMRRMPVVSGNLRETTKEYNLLGYHIPEGMNITFGHQYISTLESQYPRPWEYIPERWLVEKDDPIYYGKAHAFATMPFGFGTRMCIGRRIAELEMETFLARLIQNFKVEWVGPPPTVKTAALNYVKGPYNFIFKDL